MLALLNHTSRTAKFLFWTCPDTHRRLPWPEDKPPDKEAIEDRKQSDFSTSLDADADDTAEPLAQIEPLASPSQHPAWYEEVPFQAEPSSLSATSSTTSRQIIQHILTGASHFTIGQLNQTNYRMDREELRILLVQVLQANSAQHSLSQHVGYNRENGVRIVDALGGELILPPSIIRQYSDVHDFMLKHFHAKLGEERVVERRYGITTEHDGTLIQPDDWNRVLSSGEGLIMCMTIKKMWVGSVKDTCPQCGKTRLGTFRDAGWLVCRRCGKRFQSPADSMSVGFEPPIRDVNIASFRHVRKEFVKAEWGPFDGPLHLTWWDAEHEEELLFEGEVRPRAQ